MFTAVSAGTPKSKPAPVGEDNVLAKSQQLTDPPKLLRRLQGRGSGSDSIRKIYKLMTNSKPNNILVSPPGLDLDHRFQSLDREGISV